jgi:uncharacterized membrane-anchored protein
MLWKQSSIFLYAVVLLNLICGASAIAAGDQSAPPKDDLQWLRGPGKAPLGDIAEFDTPADGLFLDRENTAKFMKQLGNHSSPSELGTIVRKGWGNGFAVFAFDSVGYVSDEEKDKIDADAILTSIKDGTEESNKTKPQGAGLHVTGWSQRPHYDPATHHLEWAILAKDDNGGEVINHQIRILGRSGVMKVILVGGPTEMTAMVPDFRKLLTGYSFKQGNRYAEYRQGDRVAAYGLSALVAGGAAAVALKSGILQKFGKAIFIGVIALFASLRKWFMGLFSRRKKVEPEPVKSSDV